MMNEILNALSSIPVADLDRDTWLRVGIALKEEGFDVSVWDEWSQDDDRYHEGECERLWNGFGGSDNPITAGTIFRLALSYGWSYSDSDEEIGWDDVIQYEGYEDDEYTGRRKKPDTSRYTEPDIWNPVEEFRRYLQILFRADEHVAYTTLDAEKDTNGKYRPRAGLYDRTAGQLLASLDRYPDDISYTIGDWIEEAGAWIQFNPVDGKGVKKENVTRFDYALVESDTLPLEEQESLFREAQLPIAVLMYSGGKSLHAIVRVNAPDVKEYERRVRYLYNYLRGKGIEIDEQNSNPNRKSRMPGVTRDGRKQFIVATNIGKSCWDEWVRFAENESDKLPDMVPLSNYSSPPELPGELIEGILRKGHKMLISGSSKAGKSFLLMELAIAIAEGGSWLGFRCTQGKVLYINLEIDPSSCINRFFKIYESLGIQSCRMDNIVIWNLRGHAIPLDKLVPRLVHRIQNQQYAAVVVDPIYKVISGDENNASDMAKFVNCFDRICDETGSAVIYCHHHSKGAQGAKKAMDRASGSGVFARDPDSLLDLIELQLSEDVQEKLPNDYITGWRMESSLREFQNIRPVNFFFEYPIHRVDDKFILANMTPAGIPRIGGMRSEKPKTTDDAATEFRLAYDMCNIEGQVTVKDISEYLGLSEKTVYERVRKLSNEFSLDRGSIVRTGVQC